MIGTGTLQSGTSGRRLFLVKRFTNRLTIFDGDKHIYCDQHTDERCSDVTDDMFGRGMPLYGLDLGPINDFVGHLRIRRSAGKQVNRQSWIHLSNQSINIAARQYVQPNTSISTTSGRFANGTE